MKDKESDQLYFTRLLNIASEISNKRIAKKIINGLSYKTLLRLKRQELMYHRAAIDPSTTESGQEMLQTMELCKLRFGDEPTEDKLRTAMNEDRHQLVGYREFMKHRTYDVTDPQQHQQPYPPAHKPFEDELSFSDYYSKHNADGTSKYKRASGTQNDLEADFYKALAWLKRNINA